VGTAHNNSMQLTALSTAADAELFSFPRFTCECLIPNETTLKAFAEDKYDMPVFRSIEELRKDLLS
jgi:hypothetical protein